MRLHTIGSTFLGRMLIEVINVIVIICVFEVILYLIESVRKKRSGVRPFQTKISVNIYYAYGILANRYATLKCSFSLLSVCNTVAAVYYAVFDVVSNSSIYADKLLVEHLIWSCGFAMASAVTALFMVRGAEVEKVIDLMIDSVFQYFLGKADHDHARDLVYFVMNLLDKYDNTEKRNALIGAVALTNRARVEIGEDVVRTILNDSMLRDTGPSLWWQFSEEQKSLYSEMQRYLQGSL